MAHFILEYSDNIDKQKLALQDLFAKLHQIADDSNLFPYKGIRSRAYQCNNYRIADGNPQHIFLHLTVLMGIGRSMEDKESVAKQFFEVYKEHFISFFEIGGVAMSFEMKELEPVLKYNQNNIQDYL